MTIRHSTLKCLNSMVVVALLSAGGSFKLASAQSFPVKPIRTVMPVSAGSGPDSVVRQVGEKLGRAWGQPLIVDNKPGANGWLAIGEAKRAAADGYTLLMVDNAYISLQPLLYKKLPFDPVKDLEPVAPLYTTNFFIVVSANSPYKTVGDLIAAAKVKNGQMTYGTWGMGSVAHLGTSMLESATGTTMTHVPYKELPQLYTDVATGMVDWAFGSAATAGPLYRSKKVRFIALAAPKRLAEYSDVPTVAEAGGPANFELKSWVALYGPKGIPKATLTQINEGVNKALGESDTRERLAGFGFQPWIAAPADVLKAAEDDARHFAGVVKRLNISLD